MHGNRAKDETALLLGALEDGRLNAVNPAVGLSAPKYQVPERVFELKQRS
jgi:hypothetical protein